LLHEQGQRAVLFVAFAAEQLGAFKVGLLKRDETKQELEYSLIVVVDLHGHISRHGVWLGPLDQVRLLKLNAQNRGENKVGLCHNLFYCEFLFLVGEMLV
jgi:hypothetical protein